MGADSKIEWTDRTFNPWWGCVKVSEGCKFCYAETLDNRYHNKNPHWGPGSSRKPASEKYWKQLEAWDYYAWGTKMKNKVFVASMADIFEDHPDVVNWRARLFNEIDSCPHLIFQLLTKRPENIMRFIPAHWQSKLPDNVWIGTTVENQDQADVRIPVLVQVPAKVRFLSCEPLLGKIELDSIWLECPMCEGSMSIPIEENGEVVGGKSCPKCLEPYQGVISGIHWVICGGESGIKARPMNPEWANSLRDQCKRFNIPFFFKQWGEWHPFIGEATEELFGPDYSLKPHFRFDKENIHMYKVGKKLAGSLLDGVEHKNFPR